MEHVLHEITQPSDLYGQEILPECTFESEYGKLILGSVVVPDFSSDEKGAVRLKEEFDYLKSFIEEKELSKKQEIVERVHENEFSAVDSQNFSDFIDSLRANIRARTFELGIYFSFNISMEFGYNINAKLSDGMVHYNNTRVIQPLSCAAGVYTYCLKYVLNPDIFCPQDYEGLKNEILIEGIPTHNYLSWAFFCASVDNYLLSLVSDVHFCLH